MAMLTIGNDYIKVLTVTELRAILEQIPDGLLLTCSPVTRDLAVLDDALDVVGAVSFLDGAYTVYGAEEEDEQP